MSPINKINNGIENKKFVIALFKNEIIF